MDDYQGFLSTDVDNRRAGGGNSLIICNWTLMRRITFNLALIFSSMLFSANRSV
ncbi:Uncharacterized protein DAT39_010998 [Clarias magur]|uniref:Uncharacterized protein n=1 Tax=Clarias magur TaxID=1594786 RepID=A0A8J4WZI6_CLAMG|nr:Uncharacterized protein DAT39_010998 [Clarias magur]